MPRRGNTRFAALLLAVAGHAGAGFMVLASNAPSAAMPEHAARGNMLMVRLTESASSRSRPATPAMDGVERIGGTKKNEAPLVSIAQPTGPHYFRMSELTRKPEVLQDAVADLIIRMPGLEPQPVVLRLLISDEGLVDQVLVEDSFLAPEVETAIREAFAKIRFDPGRIGRIAVRSQMRVEARLETMVRRLPG